MGQGSRGGCWWGFTTVLGAVLLHAACRAPGRCPDEMAAVPGQASCIDRHEAALDKAALAEGGPGGVDGVGTAVRARSAAGQIPAVDLSWHQARTACAHARKRLCRPDEWRATCAGVDGGRRYPYGSKFEPGRCLDRTTHLLRGEAGPYPTGSAPGCVSPEGVFDLSGGVWEWLETRGKGGEPAELGGGGYNDDSAGDLSCDPGKSLGQPTTTRAGALGFRCCRDR